MKEPKVKSVMTPFPYSIDLNASLNQARAMMVEHKVRHLPVTEAKELYGIVTDRDLKFLLGPAVGALDDQMLKVSDACISDCYSVDLETPLAVVLTEMAQRHIGAAVVTARGHLAGIFTATDACRVFASHLNKQFGGGDAGPDLVA